MNQKNNAKYPINDHQNNYDDLNNHPSTIKPSRLLVIMRILIPFVMIWLSLVLMFGVICMYTNPMGQDEFYRFIFFLHNPIIVTLNSLALLVALLHSILWFNSVTKRLPSNQRNSKLSAWLSSACLWIVTIAISIFFLLLVLK